MLKHYIKDGDVLNSIDCVTGEADARGELFETPSIWHMTIVRESAAALDKEMLGLADGVIEKHLGDTEVVSLNGRIRERMYFVERSKKPPVADIYATYDDLYWLIKNWIRFGGNDEKVSHYTEFLRRAGEGVYMYPWAPGWQSYHACSNFTISEIFAMQGCLEFAERIYKKAKKLLMRAWGVLDKIDAEQILCLPVDRLHINKVYETEDGLKQFLSNYVFVIFAALELYKLTKAEEYLEDICFCLDCIELRFCLPHKALGRVMTDRTQNAPYLSFLEAYRAVKGALGVISKKAYEQTAKRILKSIEDGFKYNMENSYNGFMAYRLGERFEKSYHARQSVINVCAQQLLKGEIYGK